MVDPVLQSLVEIPKEHTTDLIVQDFLFRKCRRGICGVAK
jgi:succinate dehydrogenase/fumarate reductase-like Fe-S protein